MAADLAQQLLNGSLSAACTAALVLSLSFALAAICFDTLMVEAMDAESQRRFRLSDLAALLVLLQVFAAAAMAATWAANVFLWLIADRGAPLGPLPATQRTTLIIVFMIVGAAWWWRNTRMLSGARVESGSVRFWFLAFWTPIGYLSLFSLLAGAALLVGVIASGRAMADDRLGWLPVIRVYGVGAAFLVSGFVALFATRFRCKRIADDAFRQRLVESCAQIKRRSESDVARPAPETPAAQA